MGSFKLHQKIYLHIAVHNIIILVQRKRLWLFQRWLRWNLMFWPPELSWELCVAEMLRLNSEDAFKLQTDGAHCRDSCLAPILTIQHGLDSWLGLETNLSEDLRNTTRAFSVVVKLQILRRFVASSIDSWLLTLRSPVEHRMDFIGLRSSDPLNMNPPPILRKRSKFFINSKWMRFYEIIKWKCFHK